MMTMMPPGPGKDREGLGESIGSRVGWRAGEAKGSPRAARTKEPGWVGGTRGPTTGEEDLRPTAGGEDDEGCKRRMKLTMKVTMKKEASVKDEEIVMMNMTYDDAADDCLEETSSFLPRRCWEEQGHLPSYVYGGH